MSLSGGSGGAGGFEGTGGCAGCLTFFGFGGGGGGCGGGGGGMSLTLTTGGGGGGGGLKGLAGFDCEKDAALIVKAIMAHKKSFFINLGFHRRCSGKKIP